MLYPITLLVIACPCALILGPPTATAIVAAIANAARSRRKILGASFGMNHNKTSG